MLTPIKKPRLPRPAGLGERIQQAGQQDPLRHRAGHRQLQDLADHAHRLPPAAGNIRRNHLNSHRATLLHVAVNNPHCPRNRGWERRQRRLGRCRDDHPPGHPSPTTNIHPRGQDHDDQASPSPARRRQRPASSEWLTSPTCAVSSRVPSRPVGKMPVPALTGTGVRLKVSVRNGFSLS